MIFQKMIDAIDQNPRAYDLHRKNIDLLGDNKKDGYASPQEVFLETLFCLDAFKPFLVSVDQMIELGHAKIDCEEFSLASLKMPFSSIFIDFNGTLYDDAFRHPLKAIMLEKIEKNGVTALAVHGLSGKTESKFTEILYHFSNYRSADDVYDSYDDLILGASHFVFARKSEVFSSLNDIYKEARDGNGNIKLPNPEGKERGLQLLKLAIGFVLYVNSVNVEIIKVNGDERQNKKRKQQHKPIPEPYYFCKLERKKVITDNEKEGSTHGYQYDVRGHFAHYKKTFRGKPVSEYPSYNPETQSIIHWIPPHRRGLASDVYRPKTYLAI